MTLEQIFSVSGAVAMVGWLILLFAPRHWRLVNAYPKYAAPVALSLLYAGLIGIYFFGAEGGYGSLAEVRALFGTEELLLAGWVHYLAFDLMIGGFLAERMDRGGVHRVAQAPVLLLTFLFGPVGVLAAYAVEGAYRPLAARVEAV